jgi:hypothetical protein
MVDLIWCARTFFTARAAGEIDDAAPPRACVRGLAAIAARRARSIAPNQRAECEIGVPMPRRAGRRGA